jgi:hypothetical protein
LYLIDGSNFPQLDSLTNVIANIIYKNHLISN